MTMFRTLRFNLAGLPIGCKLPQQLEAGPADEIPQLSWLGG